MKITEDEIKLLTNASTEREWNAACDKIKGARGGAYPPDWYTRVLGSGLMARKVVEFKGAVA